jgi:hypothetical protein
MLKTILYLLIIQMAMCSVALAEAFVIKTTNPNNHPNASLCSFDGTFYQQHLQCAAYGSSNTGHSGTVTGRAWTNGCYPHAYIWVLSEVHNLWISSSSGITYGAWSQDQTLEMYPDGTFETEGTGGAIPCDAGL